MKFLCLHGTDTNTQILQMQLAPLTHPLSLPPSTHKFTYLPGPLTVPTAFPGIDPSIPGPFHRYYDRKQIDMEIFTSQFYDLAPGTSTPEDRIRQLRALGLEHARSTSARDYVLNFVENSEEGPFDGIIAFSEGTAVAADVILLQALTPSALNANRFKCAIFICGAPAWDYALQRYLLSDENAERIRIPTVHVVGVKDQMKAAGMALYGFCDEVGRELYVHPGGHVVPTGLMGKKAMLGLVGKMLRRVEEDEARRVEREDVELGRRGEEGSGSQTSGSGDSRSGDSGSRESISRDSSSGFAARETTALGKGKAKKRSLEDMGMRSEWEDVVHTAC